MRKAAFHTQSNIPNLHNSRHWDQGPVAAAIDIFVPALQQHQLSGVTDNNIAYGIALGFW